MKKGRNYKHPKDISETWFWKYVVDNKFVSLLFIALLLFLTIFAFSRIAYLFASFATIFSIIGPPFLFAILFYYFIEPMVANLERRGIKRKVAIWLVFTGIIIVISLAITFIIPGIRKQFNELVDNFPRIWRAVSGQVEALLYDEWISEIYREIQATDIISRITTKISNVFTLTLDSIGSVIGAVTRIGITVFTMPFIVYYFLVDGDRFKRAVFKVTPVRARPTLQKFIKEAGWQVGSYVRGQLLVAISVSIMFYIGYSIIDLDYALVLSILAGLLNLVPYLGSIFSTIPALIIGAFVSPFKLLQVILVLAVEQFVEGRFVSPLILGNTLDIHPLIILFILLVAGSAFGFLGLVFAVPGFGVLRVIWHLLFEWIKENYDYYDEPDSKEKMED